MNPRQALVGASDFQDLLVPCALGGIRLLLTLEKTRDRFWYRRNVAAYVHRFASYCTGLDYRPYFRGSILRRQASVHRRMRAQCKSLCQRSLALGYESFKFLLGFHVRKRDTLQPGNFGLSGKVLCQGALDVTRMRALPFNAIAVVRVHGAQQFAQPNRRGRMHFAGKPKRLFDDFRRARTEAVEFLFREQGLKLRRR